MKNQIVLGIDVGGSHITIAPADLLKKQILSNHTIRLDFDSNKKRSEIIPLWTEAIRQVANDCSIPMLKIGLAFPGPFDYEKGICFIKDQNKYEDFFNFNVRTALAESLQIDENHIFFMNDAACFLKGELFINSDSDYKRPFGIALGTGLGSAKILHNTVVDAELWNSPFRVGIAEDYLSTKWFLKRYQSLTGKLISSVKQLAANASGMDEYEKEISNAIFTEFGENFAEFISSVFATINPDIIILGGNIGKSLGLFQPSFNATLKQHGYAVDILLSKLGEDAAIMGAASLCFTQETMSEMVFAK